ncbi:hypothetical protein AC579_2556 [Pseudocercospora musae]|uniref:Protein kinase domain-containing protein n=1 Tax=Pseudocercospora musae TaxID=113226 RepID=A0A139I296_9PEZI|nr:hypothetical protein AC579_2556 [Pseudocercospora musae]
MPPKKPAPERVRRSNRVKGIDPPALALTTTPKPRKRKAAKPEEQPPPASKRTNSGGRSGDNASADKARGRLQMFPEEDDHEINDHQANGQEERAASSQAGSGSVTDSERDENSRSEREPLATEAEQIANPSVEDLVARRLTETEERVRDEDPNAKWAGTILRIVAGQLMAQDISQHFLDYLTPALRRDDWLDCVCTIGKLMALHSLEDDQAGNGDKWTIAGDIGNYVEFGIDWEESWADQGPQGRLQPKYDPSWSKTLVSLRDYERDLEIGDELSDELYHAFQRARNLARDGASIYLAPVHLENTEEWSKYINSTLPHNEKTALQNLWTVAADRMAESHGEDAKTSILQKMQQALDAWDQDFYSPVMPEFHVCETAWELMFERIDEITDDPADLAFKVQIGDLHEYYLEFQRYNPNFTFKPPPFVVGTALVEYHNKLLEDFTLAEYDPTNNARIENGWKREGIRIKFEDEPELDNFDARYTAMQNHMRKTGKAYVHDMDPPPPMIIDLTGEPRALRLGLRGVRTDSDAEWQWVRTLGEGGFGHAGLWERVGEDGGLIDRIVAKESYHKRFTSSSLWHGPSLHRIPKEGALMEMINHIPDSENVLQCQGWRVYGLLRIIRIYVDYCEYGDLEQLIKIYDRKRETNIEDFGSSSDHYLPVRAIWAIFESLVAALCLLHYGGMPWHSSGPEWKPMLHRDIKPRNIFLGKSDNIIWNNIPTPKLGDFGLVTHDYSIPGAGTKGYQAPEQYRYESEDADYNEENPVTLKSDIWAVGRTILALMNLEMGSDVKSYKFNSQYELPEYYDDDTEAYFRRI